MEDRSLLYICTNDTCIAPSAILLSIMPYQIVYHPAPRSGFENVLVKIRRNGFLLYTSIVVISTLYVCFIIKPPKPQPKPHKKPQELPETSSESSFDNILLDEVLHPVDRWTKRELYQFLAQHKVYPTVDEPILHVRATAKKYYQGTQKAP